MRILIVTSKYLPSVGGLETAVHALNRQLRACGHDTLIVTNRHSRRLPQVEEIDGTTVRRFFFTSGLPRLSPVQLLKYPARLAAAPAAYAGLKRAIHEFRPDVINLHFVGHPTAYLLAALRGLDIPLVVSLHGEDVETDLVCSPVRRRVFASAVSRAACVTSNSQYLLDLAVRHCPGIRAKGAVVGNGCDPLPAPTLSVPGERTVLSAGRLVKKKGIDILLRAFAAIAPENARLRLIIAGDGPEMSALQSLALSLGISDAVDFEGSVGRQALSDLMARAAVFCLPSRKEPFGIVLLEALSFGLPVVATAVGGVPEVLEGGKLGYLVPPDDPGAMAEAIRKALAQGPPQPPEVLKSLVRARYDWAVVTARYLSVYEQAIASQRPRSP